MGVSLVLAGYSSSISIVFAANCEFSEDKTMAYCTVNTGLPDERVYFCTKNGTWHCTYVEAQGNPPPSLSDAIAKADSVRPDLKGGNTTKVPKSGLLNDGGILKGQDDNQSTSKTIVGPQDRFCVEGTGGDSGSPCLPCDPGLKFEVGCIDVTTGGPLDMPDAATSESGENDDTNPKDLDGSNNDDNGPNVNPGSD